MPSPSLPTAAMALAMTHRHQQPPRARAATATASAPATARASTTRHKNPTRIRPSAATNTGDSLARLGITARGFRVHRVSSAACCRATENLLDYSRRSFWESFARETETVVLVLDHKTLVSELRILNKNACTVQVSVAIEDRPRAYVPVRQQQHLPHSREVRIPVGFFPCYFVRIDFVRIAHPSIAVYGIQVLGVTSEEIEIDSGPSLCTVLSHTPENLLFGPSLRASLPFRDCLSDQRSGSPEWMERQRRLILDERIARLEAALYAT